MAVDRTLRSGAGTVDPDRCDLSGRVFDVPDRFSAHFLRDRLFQEVRAVKIVVWRSPKVLGALLRRLFGIREE